MELKHELFKTVKVYKENWGHTYIYFSYKNHQDIAEIISSMFTKYAECNAHVCKINSSDDFIMGWGELQNQGLIYYSLYEAAGRENRIISEFPYTQNEKRMMEEGDENKQQHKNRIDYHIHDTKKGRVLLVEYKHCCITLDPKNHSEFSDILCRCHTIMSVANG